MISAVVVTNGKKMERLTDLLGKLKNLSDELVVIIDSAEYSVYKTIEVYANSIKCIPGKGFFEAYYEDILRNCTCEWILRIDDDEILDDAWSKEELQKLSEDTYATGYWFPRRWFINDKEYICTSPWYPDYQLRFFRNLPGIMILPKHIHEVLTVYGEVRRVDNLFIDHFCLIEDVNHRKEKVEKYKLLNPYNSCDKYYLYEKYTYDLATKISNDSIIYINECSIIQGKNDYCIKISEINLKKKMICGETYAGSIKITNYTRKTFLPDSNLHNNYNNNIFISYHIYKDNYMNEEYSFDNRRFFLPSRLLPNESIDILISIEAPSIDGDFYIRFDIVEEHVTWFSQQNKADMYPLVKISTENKFKMSVTILS
jgi:hypothetical protein